MSHTSSHHPNSDQVAARLIDHLLGEETVAERSATRAEIANDINLAVECAEVTALFDGMRELTVEPSGEVALAVRYALERRARLRRLPNRGPLWLRASQVAAVAAVLVVCFVLIDRFARENVAPISDDVAASSIVRLQPAVDPATAELLAADRLPVTEPSFVASFERFASLAVPESFDGWLDASADLAASRERLRLCFSPARRRSVLHAIGAPNLDHRTERLAATVARRIVEDVVARRTSVSDLSLALRGMIAAGSSLREGPHSLEVEICVTQLVDRLGQLDEGETATALAALADLAIIEGGALVDIVGRYTDALARATLTARENSRPGLLHWRTHERHLADAGRVFRVAPAFGIHAGIAFRARMMVAAHLEERLSSKDQFESPSLLAARIYGFGDLIDVDATERALRLWNARLLMPDFVTLHHLAWSKAPTRPGWAAFQQELRSLSSVTTPEPTGDAAALLLCLSMNVAAPGALASLDFAAG